MNNLPIILAVINLLTFIVFAVDKHKARHALWRTPEWVLLLLSAAGGSIGALFSMYLFHHKTKKFKFYFLIPLMLVIQIALILYICCVSLGTVL